MKKTNKVKVITYRHYSIAENINGWNARVGLSDLAFPWDLSSVNRVKIAIDLWLKFHMNYDRFWKHYRFLQVKNPRNYNGVWGKLKTVSELRKIAAS